MNGLVAILLVASAILVSSTDIDPAVLATLKKFLSANSAAQSGSMSTFGSARAAPPPAAGPQQGQQGQSPVQGQQQPVSGNYESLYGNCNTASCPSPTCSILGQTCLSNTDCCDPYTCQKGSTGCGVCCYTANCGSDFDPCCSNSDCCCGYACYMVEVNITKYVADPPRLVPFFDKVCLPSSTYH